MTTGTSASRLRVVNSEGESARDRQAERDEQRPAEAQVQAEFVEADASDLPAEVDLSDLPRWMRAVPEGSVK
jgi:alkylated DNA nucleotide flippase Atl1